MHRLLRLRNHLSSFRVHSLQVSPLRLATRIAMCNRVATGQAIDRAGVLDDPWKIGSHHRRGFGQAYAGRSGRLRDQISRCMRLSGDAITLEAAQLRDVPESLLLPVAAYRFQAQSGIRTRNFIDGPGEPLGAIDPAAGE
jgi:hypothetical protein